MASKPKNKMPLEERAKQFMPFAALKGLPDALAVKEKITVPQIELSEEMAEELDRKMHLLAKGQIASIVYFHKEEYVKQTGMIARIDTACRFVQIVNTKIRFEDILDVEVEGDLL